MIRKMSIFKGGRIGFCLLKIFMQEQTRKTGLMRPLPPEGRNSELTLATQQLAGRACNGYYGTVMGIKNV